MSGMPRLDRLAGWVPWLIGLYFAAHAVIRVLISPSLGKDEAEQVLLAQIEEQGIDVELANWRGVVAPPEISEEGRQCLVALVDAMVASDGWRETREKYGWQDFALSGDDFATFLSEDRDRVIEILTGLGLVA